LNTPLENYQAARTVIEDGCERVSLDVTSMCNTNACITCHHTYEKWGQHMPREMMDNVTGFLKNTRSIFFVGGGEPLTNPDLFYFIERAKAENPDIVTDMFTNGLMLEKHAARLAAVGLDGITISIDGSNDVVYRAIRGVELERVLSGIDKLREVAPDVSITVTCVVQKMNLFDAVPMVRLASSVGARAIGFSPMQLLPKLPEWVMNLRIREREWVKLATHVFEEAAEVARELEIEIWIAPQFSAHDATSQGQFYCLEPFGQFLMASQGGVIPCCKNYKGEPLGSLIEQPLSEIWNGPSYQELRRCIIAGEIYPGCETCEGRFAARLVREAGSDDETAVPTFGRDVSELIESSLARAKGLSEPGVIPPGTRFKFVKRIINRLIRFYTAGQVQFNREVVRELERLEEKLRSRRQEAHRDSDSTTDRLNSG